MPISNPHIATKRNASSTSTSRKNNELELSVEDQVQEMDQYEYEDLLRRIGRERVFDEYVVDDVFLQNLTAAPPSTTSRPKIRVTTTVKKGLDLSSSTATATTTTTTTDMPKELTLDPLRYLQGHEGPSFTRPLEVIRVSDKSRFVLAIRKFMYPESGPNNAHIATSNSLDSLSYDDIIADSSLDSQPLSVTNTGNRERFFLFMHDTQHHPHFNEHPTISMLMPPPLPPPVRTHPQAPMHRPPPRFVHQPIVARIIPKNHLSIWNELTVHLIFAFFQTFQQFPPTCSYSRYDSPALPLFECLTSTR